MTFLRSNVLLETFGEREFQLKEDVKYEGKCGVHTVPAGFKTDFASVPPMVQWLIPSYGKYALAAIVHDWYCVELARLYRKSQALIEGTNLKMKDVDWGKDLPVTSRDLDAMFRRMMRELEVPFLRRWVMWTGVRWGAMLNKARRPGVSRDLPLMVLWSILAAPVVAPVSLFVGIGLLVDMTFQGLVGRFLK